MRHWIVHWQRGMDGADSGQVKVLASTKWAAILAAGRMGAIPLDVWRIRIEEDAA